MSVLNRDLQDIASDIGNSFDEFYQLLCKEEIKPRHVEEVATTIVAVLFLTFSFSIFAPEVFSAQPSSFSAATAVFALAETTHISTVDTNTNNLTQEQIDSVLALLASYNADENTIKRVTLALGRKNPVATAAIYCHIFQRNLRIGDKGEDVDALQKGLREAGFTIATSTTGTFDDATASAVTGFQEKYKEDVLGPSHLKRGNGFVGPSTRAKLNMLYQCKEHNRTASSTPSSLLPGAHE